MAGLRFRTLLTAVVVAATLFAAGCSSAMRYDTAWLDEANAPVGTDTPAEDAPVAAAPDAFEPATDDAAAPAGAAPQIVPETGSSVPVETPDRLAFAGPESGPSGQALPPPRPPEGGELPLDLQPVAEGPARVAEAGAADWSAFERSIRDNLAAGLAESPTVLELASFEQAALAVCDGEVTPRTAAGTFGLAADAQRSLNAFAPAMCHLAPTDAGALPGPTVGVVDWPMLIQTRWRQGAQWIDLADFEQQARLACLGLDSTAAMSASSSAQIQALVTYGECALAWND